MDEISADALFQTEEGYRNALDGVYAVMKDNLLGYNFGIYSIPEAINDDLVEGDPLGSFTFDGTDTDIYPLAYDASGFQIEGFWSTSYEAINNANSIINAGRRSELTNKDVYLAEALGQRALLHYNLYRFFSPAYNFDSEALGIPYRLETDNLLDIKTRGTTKETIEIILNDLLEAEALAANNVNSYRISKTAIQAILARVYHEINDFENAAVFAEKALTDGRYKLDTDMVSFTNQWEQDESNEIIFRIRFSASDNGQNTAVLAIPGYFSFPYYVSNELIDLYDQENDFRFSTYFELEPFGSGAFYPKKHISLRTVNAGSSDPGATDIKLVRVPELYLILAEAYNKLGNNDLAKNNLNTLRNARGIEDYQGDELSNEILNERRRELAFEGFRFTDLKRLGLGLTREDGTSLAPNADRFALPIPQLEIDRSGLTQNKGY